MAVVGPGAVKQDEIAPDPRLDKASEFEYVTILNPLTDDFKVNVAQDVPVNMPFELHNPTDVTKTEQDVTMRYGVGLKNSDHVGKKYIYQQAVIPAGKTMNFKGNEAQVVVKQLVNEILQREGKSRLMSDPNLRREVEDSIIFKRGSIQDILDQGVRTPQQQATEAIKQSNEVTDDQFPGLSQASEATGIRGADLGYAGQPSQKRVPGRPRKTLQTP